MTNSSFDMAKIRANPNRAVGHTKPNPKMPLEIPIIPSGGFYTSANDMAKYIQFHLNRGSVNGQSLLSPALLEEMYTVPAPSQGSPEGYALGVARTGWYKGRNAILLDHGGGGWGFLADLWWLPELKIGITVLTNSTDHTLQGGLALEILDELVQDQSSVYYRRLMALPNRPSVVEGDSHYRPPFGLGKAIEEHAMQASNQDQLRWKSYIGDYDAKIWGVLDPLKVSLQVYQLGTHLYVKPIDTGEGIKITEVSPGLFFAGNGEVLDFRATGPDVEEHQADKGGERSLPVAKRGSGGLRAGLNVGDYLSSTAGYRPPGAQDGAWREGYKPVGAPVCRRTDSNQPVRIIKHRPGDRHSEDHLLRIPGLASPTALAEAGDACAFCPPDRQCLLTWPECTGMEK